MLDEHLSLRRSDCLSGLANVSTAVLSLSLEVYGTVYGLGRFLQTTTGFVPMCLEEVPVLFQKWLVEVEDKQSHQFPGVRIRKKPQQGAQKGDLVKWGTVVCGNPVDDTWIKVDEDCYLPIKFKDGHQVLWPDMGFSAKPQSPLQSLGKGVELCLLAPFTDKDWKYAVTGTFANGAFRKWQDIYELQPSGCCLPAELRNRGMAVFQIEISIQELKDADFKFARQEKASNWDKLTTAFTSLALISEKTVWEYQETDNNRRILAGSDLLPGSRLFMSWGKPEVTSSQDILDFLRIALTGNTLHDLDAALRSVDEVERSIGQVSCHKARFDMLQGTFARSLRIALSEMFSCSYGPARPKPCPGLYAWMAVLEQEGSGDLQGLNLFVREEFLSVVASWPPNTMSHRKIAGGVHKAAKAAVLQECRTGVRLSQQWLQAAIQTILRKGVSSDECEEMAENARRVNSHGILQWETLCLEGASLQEVHAALKVALRPAGTARQVWDAATRFLQSPNGCHHAPVCARLALQEVLTLARSEPRFMNWDEVVVGLQSLLDQAGEGRFDDEWQKDITTILRYGWEHSQGRRNRIPEFCFQNKSIVMLAKAVTAEPDRASFVEFEDKSALAWLRLAAAVGFEEYVLALEPVRVL